MRRLIALAGLAAMALSLPSCATETAPLVTPVQRNLHALFVGVDRYRFSRAGDPNAQFDDLHGAVGDAARFKAALAKLYGLDVDRPAAGQCDTASAHTRTLTDGCATRAAVLAALDAQIAALKPGATLIFYFAGHGSRYRDDERFDQASGYNGTILPSDARNPDGAPGDIFDYELKARKDRATAAGIQFVSVFDSCNSGTATRDGASGQARSVPILTTPPPARPPESAPAPQPGAPRAGYWVHLAAAQDGEEAQETASGAIGARAGVFTTALIETLEEPGMSDASFGDIIREVRLRVAARGHVSQNPMAEGELTASIGARSRVPLLFEAVASGDRVTLAAGQLSGVTLGSTYVFYPSQKDAGARTNARGTGTVTRLSATDAEVTPAGGAALSGRLVAEESAHVFPADLVTISNDLPAGADHDRVDRLLQAMAFVRRADGGAAHIVAGTGARGGIALVADDGTRLADDLGGADDPGFGARLEGELRKIARVRQLLALRTDTQTDAGTIGFCIDDDAYRPRGCLPPDAGGMRRIALDRPVVATAINRGAQPAYIYVLAIDPRNTIDLILPLPDELDQAVRPDLPYRRDRIALNAPGVYRFVVIATDRPIRAEAFQQSGNGTRDPGVCISPLERLLCAANEGTRDPGVTAVGAWSASIATAMVDGVGGDGAREEAR